jgi:hypothetical protein
LNKNHTIYFRFRGIEREIVKICTCSNNGTITAANSPFSLHIDSGLLPVRPVEPIAITHARDRSPRVMVVRTATKDTVHSLATQLYSCLRTPHAREAQRPRLLSLPPSARNPEQVIDIRWRLSCDTSLGMGAHISHLHLAVLVVNLDFGVRRDHDTTKRQTRGWRTAFRPAQIQILVHGRVALGNRRRAVSRRRSLGE